MYIRVLMYSYGFYLVALLGAISLAASTAGNENTFHRMVIPTMVFVGAVVLANTIFMVRRYRDRNSTMIALTSLIPVILTVLYVLFSSYIQARMM